MNEANRLNRRLCVKVSLFLVLGAVISVTMAWWLALLPTDYVAYDATSRNGHFDLIVPIRGLGRRLYRSPGRCWATEYHREIVFDPTPSPDLTGEQWYRRLPAASRLRIRSPVEEFETQLGRRTNARYEEHISGWPFSAMMGYELVEGRGIRMIRDSGGRLMIPKAWRPASGMTWIPCRPLWSGLVLDSVLYGALLAGITLGPRQLWKRNRVKQRRLRGACVTCGYDLQGLEHAVCPECGALNA